MMSEWGARCLALRAAIVASLYSATESSKQAKHTAPLKSPSSSFVETLVGKERNESDWPWDLPARQQPHPNVLIVAPVNVFQYSHELTCRGMLAVISSVVLLAATN